MNPLQFICLKWGSKYSPAYVNKLYGMINRFTTQPFILHCITEDSHGIRPEVKIIPLNNSDLIGWWYKLTVFQDGCYGLTGTILFLDLDVVITADLAPLFEYSPKSFIIAYDAKTGGYNSSVFRLHIGSHSNVWTNFISRREEIISTLHGDQDWITEQITDAGLWPDGWVISFKKDCNARMQHTFGKAGRILRKFNLMNPKGIATLPLDAKIILFHGKPDPEDVIDQPYDIYKAAPWIKDYWHE